MEAIISPSDKTWELMWAPYDQPTYNCALETIRAEDVVLEIGAGDLRLAFQIAANARQVIAIEIQSEIISQGLSNHSHRLPSNLTIMCADACLTPFPAGLTVGVLLMRHCTYFNLYASKLKAAGCKRLITNARWKLGVEVIELQAHRLPFKSVKMGSYACWCGATGFVNGPAESYTQELDQMVFEVMDCPQCADF